MKIKITPKGIKPSKKEKEVAKELEKFFNWYFKSLLEKRKNVSK